MIENLEEKLKGTIPINREELFELVNSWGRSENFYVDNFNNKHDVLIKKCSIGRCYDLSDLNVSEIKDLSDIFYSSPYNGDLSKWNISKVQTMQFTFSNSKFNNDSISNWDVSNVIDMMCLFYKSIFNCNISKWNVENVENMYSTFDRAFFDGDISKWKFHQNLECEDMFYGNENFEKKYNNKEEIPTYNIEEFIKWFEENRNKIASLNISKDELVDIDDYLDNFNEKELKNGN